MSDKSGLVSNRDLLRIANDLAVRLDASGVVAGDIVAVASSLSSDLVAALVATWSLGATPWPFDPTMPDEQLHSMFGSARPTAIVLRPGQDLQQAATAPRLSVAAPADLPELAELPQPPTPSDDDRLAYLLFTSGSTGVPKGVAMPMAGFEALLRWQDDQQGPGPVGQYAARTFDVSFQEIGTALWSGRRLVVFTEDERHDPLLLAERMNAEKVESLFLPTAALHGFCESLPSSPLPWLRRVFVAGEQLRVDAAVRAFFTSHPSVELHNHYGPTETHVVTALALNGDPEAWPDLPSIGQPLPEVEFEVIASDGGPAPAGELGELVIRGPRVAAGYVIDGVVTISGGFRSDASDISYATGDVVRVLDDEIQYVGRVDTQVKIRGHRIETSAVEAVIGRHHDVRACAVTAVDRGSHHELAAHVVLHGHSSIEPERFTSQSLESWCRRHLPEPSVPSIWVSMAALPTTRHGKVDRRALAAPPRTRPPVGRLVPPTTDTESVVAAAWARVLGYDEIGVEDQFGALGGTSLQATRILAALRSSLSPDIRAVDVFSHPTVRAFSAAYDRADEAAPAAPREVAGGKVAIIGMACRFPGADDLDTFWDNLLGGVDSVTRGPVDATRPDFVRAAGLLPHIDRFDAAYFGISDVEAARLDPQQRLLLELTVSAFEDAGVLERDRRRAAVFAGCGPSTYLINNLLPAGPPRDRRNLIDSVEELELLMANDKDYAATRISYELDLRGPAYAVNAACATGLVAVDAARRALMSGACDLAVAAAASVSSPALEGYEYEPGMMYSPDGFCRPFSEQAAGTIFSSGGGVVVLRRLEDALAMGDPIYAVIEGSAVGNDGRRKLGMAAPSALGQAEVIRQAWAEAEVSPCQLGMIEGHGTATPVGDAIEIEGLTAALGDAIDARSCALGSVKSNIGHLGWAAGMAGLIKAALSVSRAQIPPSLHGAEPAAPIAAPDSPFFIPAAAAPWRDSDAPRIAAVSSFGLGGANAHVVIAGHDLPSTKTPPPEPISVAYPLSAKSSASLAALADVTAGWLERENGTAAAPAATAALRRDHHPWRAAVVGSTRAELAGELRRLTVPRRLPAPPVPGFMFAGQGFDQPGMGRELSAQVPAFAEAIDELRGPFKEIIGMDLADALGWSEAVGARSNLDSIALSQPVVYCFQLALVDMWRSLGVQPSVVIGHSLGEFAAAATAGVFSRIDGLRIVAERGRLLRSLPDGVGMLAVRASAADTEALIALTGIDVELAAVNGPVSVAVAGRDGDLDAFTAALQSRDVRSSRLAISRAGHSSHMEPVLAAFGEAFRDVEMSPPRLPLVSNVTGTVVGPEVCSPDYWQRHLRETVLFADGVQAAVRAGVNVFVEISAHPTLVPLVDAIAEDADLQAVPTLVRGTPEPASAAGAVGQLHEAGVDLEWSRAWWVGEERSRIPTYRFEQTRHWIEPPSPATPTGAAPRPAPHGRSDSVTSAPAWIAAELSPDSTARRWLVIGASEGALAESYAALARGGHTVTHAASAHPSDMPGDPAAYDEIMLHLNTSSYSSVSDLRDAVEPVLTLAARAASARLTLVLADAYAIPGDDLGARSWLPSALVGLARVCQTEGVFRGTRIIDLADGRALPIHLLTDTASDEVAVRAEQILVPRWQPLSLTETASSMPVPDPEGIHVVLGGRRGLGLWTAERLVSGGARRVLLIGRSEPTASSRRRIEVLRSAGAHVDELQLDVTDPDSVAVIEAALTGHPLAGIVLAVGVVDDALVSATDWSRFEAVVRTKVAGLDVTTALLSHRPDGNPYALLYSSVAAALGTAGQASHAAANQILNTAAAHLRARGIRATAVGWGPWADEGFLVDHPETVRQLSQSGLRLMTKERATPLLAALLAASQAQVDLLEMDWASYAETLPEQLPARFTTLSGAPAPDGVPTEQGEVRESAREVVRRLLARQIGREPRFEVSLGEEGLDSLALVRLRNTINRELGLRLRTADLTTAASIGALVDSLERSSAPAGAVSQPAAQPADSPVHAANTMPASAVSWNAPSHQQRRWRSLVVNARYGHRVVPMFVARPLDIDRLRAALVAVVNRHDALTTTFPAPGRLGRVTPEEAVPLTEELVVGSAHEAVDRSTVSAAIRALRSSPPDVTQGVSWTVRAARTDDHGFVLLLSLQHLDFDGTSISVFLDELLAHYDDEQASGPARSSAPSYAEYARWQSLTYAERGDAARAYLQGLYGQIAAPTLLPGRERSQLMTTTAPRSVRYTHPEDACVTTADLQRRASTLGVSPFNLVAAAYGRAVATHFGLREITVTSVFSGRTEPRFDRVIGPMTSGWPLPVPLSPSLDDAARILARTTAHLAELASYVPNEEPIAAGPAFAGLPADTYFSDVAINFTSYERSSSARGAQVVEILGPVDHPLLDSSDFGPLAFPAGLHLIFDSSGSRVVPSLWYHPDRFADTTAAEVVARTMAYLQDEERTTSR